MTANIGKISSAVKQAFGTKPYAFRPCALFDEQLDCIRVIVNDCSVTEVRIDDRLTVLEDNATAKYVGFTIKGAKHFCNENGLSSDTPFGLANLLDQILAASPSLSVKLAVNGVARRIVEDHKIDRIDLSHGRIIWQADVAA